MKGKELERGTKREGKCRGGKDDEKRMEEEKKKVRERIAKTKKTEGEKKEDKR